MEPSENELERRRKLRKFYFDGVEDGAKSAVIAAVCVLLIIYGLTSWNL